MTCWRRYKFLLRSRRCTRLYRWTESGLDTRRSTFVPVRQTPRIGRLGRFHRLVDRLVWPLDGSWPRGRIRYPILIRHSKSPKGRRDQKRVARRTNTNGPRKASSLASSRFDLGQGRIRLHRVFHQFDMFQGRRFQHIVYRNAIFGMPCRFRPGVRHGPQCLHVRSVPNSHIEILNKLK